MERVQMPMYDGMPVSKNAYTSSLAVGQKMAVKSQKCRREQARD